MRDYLIAWRKEQGLSQRAVSAAMDISEAYYQWVEYGKRQRDMSISFAQKLAVAFCKSFEEVKTAEYEWAKAQQEEGTP